MLSRFGGCWSALLQQTRRSPAGVIRRSIKQLGTSSNLSEFKGYDRIKSICDFSYSSPPFALFLSEFGGTIEKAHPKFHNDLKVFHLKPTVGNIRCFAKVAGPPHLQRQVGIKLYQNSSGVILEPYKVHTRLPFYERWFTREGWRQRKELYMNELKTAYAVAKLRQKTGYTRKKFYAEVADLYRQINTLIAAADKNALRQLVTENMLTILKKELKQREGIWGHVHWEMVGLPKIQTLQARMASADAKNLDNAFVQITLMIRCKQKFGAYNLQDKLVAGDPFKEILVEDIWVFETAFGRMERKWKLCARISL